MALWKETLQAEQTERTSEEKPAVTPVPQRRESLSKTGQESFFGSGVTIEGKLEGDVNVRIAGRFKGNIHIRGELNVERGAHIVAQIHADTIAIAGQLEGNVFATNQVKMLESGQLIGDLKAKTLIVAAGSRMRGHVEFGWSDVENATKRALDKNNDNSKNGAAT
jgi:cytoskeletal protein CcmA (bactofilin family)